MRGASLLLAAALVCVCVWARLASCAYQHSPSKPQPQSPGQSYEIDVDEVWGQDDDQQQGRQRALSVHADDRAPSSSRGSGSSGGSGVQLREPSSALHPYHSHHRTKALVDEDIVGPLGKLEKEEDDDDVFLAASKDDSEGSALNIAVAHKGRVFPRSGGHLPDHPIRKLTRYTTVITGRQRGPAFSLALGSFNMNSKTPWFTSLDEKTCSCKRPVPGVDCDQLADDKCTAAKRTITLNLIKRIFPVEKVAEAAVVVFAIQESPPPATFDLMKDVMDEYLSELWGEEAADDRGGKQPVSVDEDEVEQEREKRQGFVEPLFVRDDDDDDQQQQQQQQTPPRIVVTSESGALTASAFQRVASSSSVMSHVSDEEDDAEGEEELDGGEELEDDPDLDEDEDDERAVEERPTKSPLRKASLNPVSRHQEPSKLGKKIPGKDKTTTRFLYFVRPDLKDKQLTVVPVELRKTNNMFGKAAFGTHICLSRGDACLDKNAPGYRSARHILLIGAHLTSGFNIFKEKSDFLPARLKDVYDTLTEFAKLEQESGYFDPTRIRSDGVVQSTAEKYLSTFTTAVLFGDLNFRLIPYELSFGEERLPVELDNGSIDLSAAQPCVLREHKKAKKQSTLGEHVTQKAARDIKREAELNRSLIRGNLVCSSGRSLVASKKCLFCQKALRRFFLGKLQTQGGEYVWENHDSLKLLLDPKGDKGFLKALREYVQNKFVDDKNPLESFATTLSRLYPLIRMFRVLPYKGPNIRPTFSRVVGSFCQAGDPVKMSLCYQGAPAEERRAATDGATRSGLRMTLARGENIPSFTDTAIIHGEGIAAVEIVENVDISDHDPISIGLSLEDEPTPNKPHVRTFSDIAASLKKKLVEGPLKFVGESHPYLSSWLATQKNEGGDNEDANVKISLV